MSARRLDAYRVGIELQTYMRPHLQYISKGNKNLAEQLDRSLPSMVNNLCEALRRTGKDRTHLLTVSLGSADEARASIDSAMVNGFMQTQHAARADELADRFCAMVYRLHERYLG